MSKTVFWAATFVTVAFCSAGLFSVSFSPIAIQSFLSVVTLALVWRRLSPLWESPILVFGIFAVANGMLGFIFSDALSRYGGTAGANTELTEGQQLDTANLFFLAAFTVLVCGWFFLRKKPVERAVHATAVRLGRGPRLQNLALVLSAAVLVFVIALYGPAWFFSRADRFDSEVGAIQSVTSLLLLVAIVLLGMAISGRSGAGRIIALVLIGLFALVYFSMASRTLSLLPFLVLAGSLLAGNTRRVAFKFLLAAGLAVALLPLPLYFRGLSSHGLFPYLKAISSLPLSADTWLSATNNVLNGFGIVGTTAFGQPKISTEFLLVSLNPATGDGAGWYEIAPKLRLNFFTPYGALGELGNQGWLFFLASCIFLGLALGYIQGVSYVLSSHPVLSLLRFLPLGLSYLFIVQSTQYNLRSEMRLIYYSVAISIVFFLWFTSDQKKSVAVRAEGNFSRPGATLWTNA